MKIILLIFVVSFILILSACQPAPICGENYYEHEPGECCVDTDKNQICDSKEIPEEIEISEEIDTTGATGPDTFCESDSDCYCGVFTGAKFLPGKSPSFCCTEDRLDKVGGCSFDTSKVNHCAICLYD